MTQSQDAVTLLEKHSFYRKDMQSREKQPFFKPISNLSACEISNPSGVYEAAVRQKTNQVFQINRQKENEAVQQRTEQEQSVGPQKLSSLHAKLHQEADRIRKWKTQTEIEIKQKDKKIQETVQTVDSLRKSILELQLQNESLSLKLQEEMGCREEIVQRINSTRDMCHLLKEHSARTEERLSKCETERTELKYLEKEHLKQFEDLSQQFSNLEITASEERNRLTDLLNKEKLQKEKLENELVEKITISEQKLQSLECQCEEKDLEIRDVRADLRKNEEKIHDLMCMLDDYKLQLTTLQDDFNKKDSLLCDSEDELMKRKENCVILETELNKLREQLQVIQNEKETLGNEYKDSENTFTTQIDCLTTELEACNRDLSTTRDRVTSLQEQLEKALNSIEDIKSAKGLLSSSPSSKLVDKAVVLTDIAIMEKSELECQLKSLIQEKENVELERDESMKKIYEMNSTIEQFTLNFAEQKEHLITEQATSDEMKNTISLLEMDKNKMYDDLEKLTKELVIKNGQLQKFQQDIEQQEMNVSCLNEELSKLSELLEQEKSKVEDLFIQKRNLGDELQCLQEELSEKNKEANSNHKEFEKSSKTVKKLENKLEECNNTEEKMRSEIEELKANLEMRLSEIESLQENREEQDKLLSGELENKAKEANALDGKIKNLKETVSSKTKQVKELEKEVRSLKSKLSSQTKETENKEKLLTELRQDLDNFKQEKQELENVNSGLKCQADEDKKSADKALKKEKEMKVQSEKAMKEKEETVQRCEHQIAEMMATLEKYQQENQKIVGEKDKEIEEMKHKIELAESKSKMETNDVITDLNDKLQDVNKKLSVAESEKVTADKKVSKLEKKLKKSDTEISKMESKIKQLQEVVDVIKSKKTEHIGVQVELEIPKPTRQEDTPPVPRYADTSTKKTGAEKQVFKPTTPNIRVAPKTPQIVHTTKDVHTPSKIACTPVLFKTPTTKTPSSAFKTPQRSILKNTDRNSCVKKRRVAFESSCSDSEDSSSSELMEFESREIEDRYKTGQKNLPLHVRPSPKLKTPEIHAMDDDDSDVDKPAISLQRKPRGPPVSKTPKQEGISKLTTGSMNKENVNLKQDISEKKPIAPRTPNVRKTPSKPPGKFFKSSPKNRSAHKPKHNKEEKWFDIDSVFGFED